jgi:hypothetical protein
VGPASCADFPEQAEQQSGIGRRVFGISPESGSPGTLFGFAGMRTIERGEQFSPISE